MFPDRAPVRRLVVAPPRERIHMIDPPVVVMPAPILAPRMEDLAERFFAEGERQEAIGVFEETAAPFRGSFDRVPRTRTHAVLLAAALTSSVGGVAVWAVGAVVGRWDVSSTWQRVVQFVG